MVDVAQYDQPAYVRQLWDVCLRQARRRLAASAPAPPCSARPSSVDSAHAGLAACATRGRMPASPLRARRWAPHVRRRQSGSSGWGQSHESAAHPRDARTTPAGVSTVGA